MLFRNQAKYAQSRVYRVIVHQAGGAYGCGSGFFINKNQFLTCFHVAFTKELGQLRADPAFSLISGADEHAKLQSFFNSKVTRIEVENSDGSRLTAGLQSFDEKYDIAILEVNLAGKKINECKLDWNTEVRLGDYVFFGGFPMLHGYNPDSTPFAVHEGVISTAGEVMVGGEKYKHLQINSINLGGNSGAPLFKKGGRRVVGIINGNMTWGHDKVIFEDPTDKTKTTVGPLRVPLSIAYATSLKTIKEESSLLRE